MMLAAMEATARSWLSMFNEISSLENSRFSNEVVKNEGASDDSSF